MAVVTITKDNFEAEVLGCKIPVVLDFWAEWCEPCKMQSTVIEELAAELDGKVKFGKVNVDEEASLALNYQIMSNYFSQIGMKSRQKIESDGLNRGKTVLKG